jgi:hypothetical protein
MRITRPLSLLRIEAAAALAVVVIVFQRIDASWLLFALLFLVPDVGMLGYLAGNRLGALTYNLCHTYALAVPLTAYGLLAESDAPAALGLIWLAHIAADRALGYGLKHASGFKDTHLGTLRGGNQRPAEGDP